MGRIKGIAPTDNIKQKYRKNRQTKTTLVFDEELRRDYLTGFRRRKEQRRHIAQQKEKDFLKEELRKKKQEKRDDKKKRLLALGIRPEMESLAPSSVYELPGHTVTVTDVAGVDFVGRTGFMLGDNQGDDELDSTMVPAEAEVEPTESLPNRKQSGKKKKKIKKGFKTHLLDVKYKAKQSKKHRREMTKSRKLDLKKKQKKKQNRT